MLKPCFLTRESHFCPRRLVIEPLPWSHVMMDALIPGTLTLRRVGLGLRWDDDLEIEFNLFCTKLRFDPAPLYASVKQKRYYSSQTISYHEVRSEVFKC